MAFFVLALAAALASPAVGTDLWIALASGRQIAADGRVPQTDSFSYTFAGRPWFNQNWLSHLLLYSLHARLGPTATVAAPWLAAAAIFTLIAARIRARTNSTTFALIAAGLAALACRGYFDPRPATFGYLLLAATWSLLLALGDPLHTRRSWPAIPLCIVLIIWACAHGSFVFGYELVALFILTAFVPHSLLPRRPRPAPRQAIAAVAAALTAFIITAVFGPFGLANFTHPLTVASSPVWRTINEWQPPWVPNISPPVIAFWSVLAIALVAALIARSRPEKSNALPQPALSLVEFAAVLVSLAMCLWARRFIPIFFIISTEPIAALIASRGMRKPDLPRRFWSRITTVLVSTAAIALLIQLTLQLRDARRALASPPPGNLFEWAVAYDYSPADGIDFIRRNNLQLNLLTDWLNAGPVVFLAPGNKVFVDGRAQQLYSVDHFLTFQDLMAGNLDATQTQQLLDDSHTDAILLAPHFTPANGLPRHILARPDDWLLVLRSDNSMLFLRRPSPALAELGQLERTDRAVWPDTPLAKATRANVLLKSDPPDEPRAIELMKSAINSDPSLGRSLYPALTAIWLRRNQTREAADFLNAEAARISAMPTPLDPSTRMTLEATLHRCIAAVSHPAPK